MAGNRPNNKRTTHQIEMLVKESAQWLYEHPTAPRGTFVKWIMENHNLEKKMAYEYRKRAYAYVHELQDKEIESKRTLRVSALEKMFHQAIEENDGRLQLEILKELNKVDNLYIHKVEQAEVKDREIFQVVKEPVKLKKVD